MGIYKRLAEKQFQWPRNEQELKLLKKQEFRWLMEGLSITYVQAFGVEACIERKKQFVFCLIDPILVVTKLPFRDIMISLQRVKNKEQIGEHLHKISPTS